MGRQIVLSAAFALVLLATVFTPGCHGRPHGEEDDIDSLLENSLRISDANEDNAEAEDEDVDEEEMDDAQTMMLLSRLLEDQTDNSIREMTFGQQRFLKKIWRGIKNAAKKAVSYCLKNMSSCVKVGKAVFGKGKGK